MVSLCRTGHLRVREWNGKVPEMGKSFFRVPGPLWTQQIME